jgi:hypothetical protein
MSDYHTSSRRYIFAKHGRPDRFRHWEQRQQRRQGRQLVYQPVPGQEPDFARIIDPENLLLAYNRLRAEGGEAPGIDGLSYSDFSRAEIAAVLRVVAQQLQQRHYRPRPTRQVRIPKGSGGFRKLRLMIVIDRIIAKAVPMAIMPTLDPVFLPGVFGFRPERSIQGMLLAIEKAATERDCWVIAQDDIRAAFDNVPIADVMADFRQHLGDRDLLWLIEALLRGAKGQERTVGIDQGNAVSPVALLLRLHYALSLPQLVDTIDSTTNAADQDNPSRQFQYADNLVYLCRSVTEGNQALQRARALLQPAGLSLKGEDGPPVNLKRQGTRVGILGFRVSYRDGRLRYGLGGKAWKSLEQRLAEAHGAADPGRAAVAAVRGWLEAHGPAFEDAEECEALERVRRTAARMGFRELDTEEGLMGWLREARQRWLAARSSALEGNRSTAAQNGEPSRGGRPAGAGSSGVAPTGSALQAAPVGSAPGNSCGQCLQVAPTGGSSL